MPPPFQRLTVPQFASVLRAFKFTRRVTAVHMHHTWRPDHSMWRGQASMEGMWRFHTRDRGFSDLAQHLTIDPEGGLWTGRLWNQAPASAIGHNGNSAAGPFMFEVVGNFDKGADPFGGAQRQAVLDVAKLVQQVFHLDAEALLFHNQVAAKSCPGTSIDRGELVAALRAHVLSIEMPVVVVAASPRGRGARAQLTQAAPAADDSALVQRTLQMLQNTAAQRDVDGQATPLEELDYSHDTASHHAAINTPAVGRGLFGGTGLGAADIDALRPYVVNLRQGRFSHDGLMVSSEADVDSLLFEHAAAAAKQAVAEGRPFKLLLYAHGGLVKESAGLATARAHAGWWRDNGVYPVHFVWETGFFESVRDLLTRSQEAAGGSRNIFSDYFSDPLLERGARALQAPRIWGAMKSSAQLASLSTGGARYFLERLLVFCQQFKQLHGSQGGSLELHAAGHSAGSIFMAHLLQAAAGIRGLPVCSSLHLMAPALRVDVFKQLLQPLLGQGVDALTVYTMRRDFERDDHCAKVYRKSLLYFVAAACEPELEVPILGLEDSLRGDNTLARFFGLGHGGPGRAEVVWSRSVAAVGLNASRATAHGEFDNDAPTMESIARRVLGFDDTTPLARRFPTGGSRDAADPWLDGVDWPPEFPRGGNAISAQATNVTTTQTMDTTPQPAPAAPSLVAGSAPSGRRLALCVGIDTYATAPLSGCVNDARQWQQTLQALGFSVSTLFNEEARHGPLVAAIGQLFAQGRPGDELVLQFAGHGTQAPDVDGDEARGDTPGLDEALCPHDFDAGPLLIDDDLGDLISGLAAGVQLTLFMDCCHAGTNSRAAPPPRSKARSVRLTTGQKEAFVQWRLQQQVPARRRAKRAASDPVEVNFGACQSRELAWESEGQGEFTLRATRILQSGGAALTPDEFYRRVVDAFGQDRRQTPHMEAPPARLSASLFRAPGG